MGRGDTQPSMAKPWKQKRKSAPKKDDSKYVEIFEGKPVVPAPSLLELTPVESGYIRIICMNESSFLVPVKVVDSFKCIDVILYSEVSFKERLENVIRFPDMSPEVMETVLRFVFTDHLNKLKADRYWGSEKPRLVFQFEVAPRQAMDLIHTAHFLGVKNLLSVAATMVAHNLEDVHDVSSLPPDLAWCIAEQLSAHALFVAEERPDFQSLNLDTECLWQIHSRSFLQGDIVPLSSTSAYPQYDKWDVHQGPPPTSWKSFYAAHYLQQLADRQNGGDNEVFMAEIKWKALHAYCHTVHPAFWEWVVNSNIDFFVSYISCFKNIFKLSLSGLPLGKISNNAVLPASKIGNLLDLLPVLQLLDLSETGIGVDGALSLSISLAQHKRIQVLYMGHNDIRTTGLSAIGHSLRSVRTLKSMNVCENNIGAWVDLDVVEAFQEAALEELILEGNFRVMNIAPETSGLPISLSTIHEDLDSLAIDKFKPTIRDLIMNGLPNGLKHLQCAKCELNDVRTKVLVNRLKCLSQIQKLDLSGNKITSEGAAVILTWLQDNTTLLELNLSNNNITDSCSMMLSRAIKYHESLEKISIMENYSFGELNLHEVLRAAMERGMKLKSGRCIDFTLDLRLTDISYLSQAKIHRQRDHYSCVNLLI